jgi:hypothetical protein
VTVRVHRLTEKRHFANASLNQASYFIDNIGERSASLAASAIRNDAIGAKKIAAIDNRNKR